MKHFNKQAEPAQFTSWKAAHPGATYDGDLSSRNSAAKRAKKALKDSLLAEQKYICCYCECRVSEANSHIEHFRPKDPAQFPHLQLEYNNLLASCTKKPIGSPDEHCGHKKSNFFSTDLVSPLETDCSDHFTYKMDGTITGVDQRGKVTVEKLHLDSALLDNQRKNLIDDFLDINDDAALEAEIIAHLDESGPVLREFITMVDYLHRNGQL